jgi:hypothetical protein
MGTLATETKPDFTVCHCDARNACTKKYAPPRYTPPSIIGVMEGLMVHAKRCFVSFGKPYKTTNATTRNGTITAESTRVAGNTASSRATPGLEDTEKSCLRRDG